MLRLIIALRKMKYYITLVGSKHYKIIFNVQQQTHIFFQSRPIVYISVPAAITIHLNKITSTPSFYNISRFVLALIGYTIYVLTCIVFVITLSQTLSAIYLLLV